MRSLTSIESSSTGLTDIEFLLKSSDASTTWTFSSGDIITMSKVNWQARFGGGIGKPSTYTITLGTSVDWIKDNLNQIASGEARLNVTVNSDTFQPHVGRVRVIDRDTDNIHLVSLTVFDRFLDDNVKYPPSLPDSFQPHPEIIEKDVGWGTYFGKQIRPFFHTATASYFQLLEPPRNVSITSNTLVSTVFYQSNLPNGSAVENKSVYLAKHGWVAGGTVIGAGKFIVSDFSTTDTRLWQYENNLTPVLNNTIFGDQTTHHILHNRVEGELQARFETHSTAPGDFQFVYMGITPLSRTIRNLHQIKYSVVISNFTTATPNVAQLNIRYPTGGGAFTATAIGSITQTGSMMTGSLIVASLSAWATGKHLAYDSTHPDYLEFQTTKAVAANTFVTAQFSLSFEASLLSEAYQNYSFYSLPVNCTYVGCFESPTGILTHIFSEFTIDFNQAAASASQATLESSDYNFQCFFSEREPLVDIIDEFGDIAKTYYWASDSGIINTRTYENSGSATVDATISTSDMLDFSLFNSPLGSTRFQGKKGSTIKVDYEYDFQSKKYLKTLNANPTNTAACDSANASGITSQVAKKTKYVMETATASSWVSKIVQTATQPEEFIRATLPFRYMQLELADVVKVQHPSIVGSESLYQITELGHDYTQGVVNITAQELLEF